MEGSPGAATWREERAPLSNVVADCVRRWFRDALEEAKAGGGDAAMQVLVSDGGWESTKRQHANTTAV
ncbi:hypothetical protein KSP39_PZI020644 [Platanthera zijinensis]|uniref:Uncharacterized protein n=1 Tax=Platanthera zijinensis TaxID=2320716 RepID=A0AAP0FXU1_9ASPA